MSGDHQEYVQHPQNDENFHEDGNDKGYLPTYESSREPSKERLRRKRSLVWRKFTIVNKQKSVASCDVCGTLMSYRSTTSNLKNHLIRKHNYDSKTHTCIKPQSNVVVGHKPQTRVRTSQQITSTHQAAKRSVSEVGGIDDLVFRVISGEEDHHATVSILPDQVIEEPIEPEDQSDYGFTTVQTADETHLAQTDSRFVIRPEDIGNGYNSDKDPEYRPSKDDKDSEDSEYLQVIRKRKKIDQARTHQETNKSFQTVRPAIRKLDLGERNKRQKILDLQLECLEMKKYNMQIETLMMEQQMNLPRSIFTQTLRGSHTYTRGTQTDIGGNKTKVFYLSNKKGEAIHHFISLQDSDD